MASYSDIMPCNQAFRAATTRDGMIELDSPLVAGTRKSEIGNRKATMSVAAAQFVVVKNERFDVHVARTDAKPAAARREANTAFILHVV